MKKTKRNIKMTIIFILIFLILLLFCIFLKLEINKIEEEENITNSVVIGKTETNPKTIDGIITKYDSEYIGENSPIYYAKFSEDLFDEEGESNREYFENMIDEICKLDEFKESTFYLQDVNKDIEIAVIYNKEIEEHKVIYNSIEDFYNKVNGEHYSNVEKTEIVKAGYISIVSYELNQLIQGNMFFNKIDQIVGEGKEINDKYTSFYDGGILLRLLNGKVRNFVFTKKYTDEVASNVKVGTDLEEILERYPNKSGGSVDKGYIYYRTDDVYIFFYDDEISAYGYSYFENTHFENFLEQYLEDNDLDTFIQNVSKKWTNQDIYEYDPTIKYAHITYPSRGVEINIKDNNPIGITLYSNYYLTEKTKKFVKEGKITLKSEEDLLLLTEIERRKNY